MVRSIDSDRCDFRWKDKHDNPYQCMLNKHPKTGAHRHGPQTIQVDESGNISKEYYLPSNLNAKL